MGLPLLLALTLPALGQELVWHTTDLGTPGGPYPVGASVRVWGPTGEVFLLRHEHERLAVATGEPYRQSAVLEQFRCLPARDPSSWCAHVVNEGQWPIGTVDEGNHMLHPSMVVRDMGPVRRLTLVRATRGYRYACPSHPDGRTQWDLAAFEVDSGKGVVSTVPLEFARGPDDCTDWGRLEVQMGADRVPWACYTHADEAIGDRVRCRRQTEPLHWSEVLDLPHRWEADHPSFALVGGHPLVAVHETDGRGHRIRLHGPGARREPIDLDDDAFLERRKNYPSIASEAGHTVVAYEVGSDTTPSVWLRSCDAGDACTDYRPDSVDDAWHEESFEGPQGLAAHPQVAIDTGAGRLFLAYGSNVAVDPRTATRARIQLATRCLATPDAPFDLFALPTPAEPAHDQVFGYGRPALELDRHHRMVHLAVIEATDWEGRMPDLDDPDTDSTLRWMRASYADLPPCPAVD